MSQRMSALDQIKLKTVAADLRPDRKELALADWRTKQGRVFERLLQLAGMTKQEAAAEMGYVKSDGSPDASQISRWVSAVERVQWDRVAAVKQLCPWIPAAWGEFTNAAVEVTVRVRVA